MDVSVDNEVIVNTNGTVEVAVGNAADAVVADDHALDITVTKKEYKIVGDEVYIAKLYDDAPQWMKDLVQLVVDNTMETESVMLRNDLIGQLNQFATSYVPLNAYTQSIIDLSNADTAMHDTLETLNSNFNDGLNTANSQIIDLQSTKASKDEVATKVIETLTAQLATPTSELGATIGNLQQTIVDGDSANADSVTTLMSVLEGEVDARASAIETINTYVGIDEAGASTGTGLSAYLEGSDGTVGGVDSELVNTIRATSSEVESKFAYNSNLSLHGTTYSSGFGLATSLVDGTIPTGQSEFWIKSDKFRLMAADGTTKSGYSPFSVNAATGDILMNGSVKFINTSGGNSTLQDVVQGYVETVQVGDKNINITDNLIPMTSMLTDIANAGYQFVATPVKTSTAGISVYAEPQVQLDVGDEIYSPFVNELVVSYYYRFGIKGITALTNAKICTIDAVDAVTYGDISYTMDAGQTLVGTDWYIIDGLINPAGGSTGIGGSIRKADGTKIGTVNVYVMPAGSTKLLLGWIGACTVSRCKLAKVNADTVTGDLASIDYVNTTQIDGGRIITGSILSDKIAANISITSPVISGGVVSGTVINGGTINGGTINGVNINGSVIKASWIDYSSTGTLTNWAYYTPATMPAQYSTNFAHDSSTGALITDSNGFVRLPKVSKVIIGSFLHNVGSTANVYTLGNVSFAGYDLDVHSFDDYVTTSTRRLLNANTRIVFDSANIPFLTVRGGAGLNGGAVGTCSATWRIGTDVFVYYGLSQAINQGADPHTYTTRLSKNGVYLMDVTATLPSGGSAAGVSYIADIVSCGIATRISASGASISVVILNAINDTVAYIGTNTTISVGVCTGYASDNKNAGIKVYVPTGTEFY